MDGASWRTSGEARTSAGGRIALPLARAFFTSSFQAEHLSSAVSPDGPAAPGQRQRLLYALLASVLLHLLLAVLLERAVGPVGRAGAGPLVATLRGLPAESLPVGSSADAPADWAAQTGAAASPESLQAALGERSLAAHVPSYLAAVVNAPASDWYFSSAELTRPPVLQDEPLLPMADNADGAERRGGKAVLRVLIAADGTVDRSELASSNLSPAYNVLLLAAFSRLRFRPGEIEGVAVSSQTLFAVELDASDSGRSHASDRLQVR